jgi:4-aminobutyrate aminotransferase
VASRKCRVQFNGSGTDNGSRCSTPRVRAMATAAQAASLVDFGETHVTKGLSRMTKGLMNKGEGSYLHFADGRKMLDFTTGIGVTVLGLSLI